MKNIFLLLLLNASLVLAQPDKYSSVIEKHDVYLELYSGHRTEDFGLTGVDSLFRYAEYRGLVYYLPGQWMPIPEDPISNFKYPAFDFDSTVKSILQARIDSLVLKNSALERAAMFRAKSSAPDQVQICPDYLSKKAILIMLIVSFFIWLITPVIYEIITTRNRYSS